MACVDGGHVTGGVSEWDASGGHADGVDEGGEEGGDNSFSVAAEAGAAKTDGIVG